MRIVLAGGAVTGVGLFRIVAPELGLSFSASVDSALGPCLVIGVATLCVMALLTNDRAVKNLRKLVKTLKG